MILSYEGKGKVNLQCENCGKIRIAQRNTAILGKNTHFCRSCSNKRNAESRKGKPSWNSGKTFEPKSIGSTHVDTHGYIQEWVGLGLSEAYGRKDGYVLQHRKVMQDHLQRPLKKGELIHHIDGNKHNNSIDNLHLCESMSHHRDIHNHLEQIAFELYKRGEISFEDGEYRLEGAKMLRQRVRPIS